MKADSYAWWKADTSDVAAEVFAVLDRVRTAQSAREESLRRLAATYDDTTELPVPGWRADVPALSEIDEITTNGIEVCVDSVHAKITRTRPKPWVLTDGGSYEMQARAKKLDALILGAFMTGGLYPLARQCFRDAEVWGDGVIKVRADVSAKRVRYERVLPWELWVDPADGLKGEPMSLYYLTAIDRGVLAELYPEHATAIEAATLLDKRTLGVDSTIDQVSVCEAWHRRGTAEGTGRHVIVLDDVALVDEEYDADVFPFARISWKPRLAGYWGKGLAESLESIQREKNRTARAIQDGQKMVGKTFIAAPRGAKVSTAELDDEHGTIYYYDGPQGIAFQTPQSVPTDLFQRDERLWSLLYEVSGTSQLSASSRLPAGMTSGRAQTVYHAIESERFSLAAEAYETFIVDLAQRTIDAFEIIADEAKGAVTVSSTGDGALTTIDYREVRMARDSFVIQVWPVGMLPFEPAGKIQTVMDLREAGAIEKPSDVKRLLNFPDLKSELDPSEASHQWVRRAIDKMLLDGEPQTLLPFQNLAETIAMCAAAYMQAATQGATEDRLALLRDYAANAKDEQKRLAAEAMPQAPQAAIPPQARGMPNA